MFKKGTDKEKIPLFMGEVREHGIFCVGSIY